MAYLFCCHSVDADMKAWLWKNGPISIGINAMAMQVLLTSVTVTLSVTPVTFPVTPTSHEHASCIYHTKTIAFESSACSDVYSAFWSVILCSSIWAEFHIPGRYSAHLTTWTTAC